MKTNFTLSNFSFKKLNNKNRKQGTSGVLNSLPAFLFTICLLCLTTIANSQTLTTDQSDYAPGSTVNITGSGFQAGETVMVQVTHNPTCCDDSSSLEHQ